MNQLSRSCTLPLCEENGTCNVPMCKVEENKTSQSLLTQLTLPLFFGHCTTFFLIEAVKNVHKAKKSLREGSYIQASKQSILTIGYSCGAAFACSQTVEALKAGFLQHSGTTH